MEKKFPTLWQWWTQLIPVRNGDTFSYTSTCNVAKYTRTRISLYSIKGRHPSNPYKSTPPETLVRRVFGQGLNQGFQPPAKLTGLDTKINDVSTLGTSEGDIHMRPWKIALAIVVLIADLDQGALSYGDVAWHGVEE